jgi:DNA repair protein RadD
MPTAERDEAIKKFKSGEVRAVVNVGVLTTGFDFPEIDLIIMLRPTASSVLMVQMLGRGTRPAPNKDNCLVLDFSGNIRRLGPINDPVIPKKKGSKGGPAPVKECPTCGCYTHTSVRFCECCGHEFVFQVKITHTAATTEIIRENAVTVEVFAVDEIVFSRHEKLDKPPTLKVSYYCGLRTFNEYVCFEHEGFARKKAHDWWNERTTYQVTHKRVKEEGLSTIPSTISDALDYADMLQRPTHLRVWMNKKYPEILAYCFDGSAFEEKKALTTQT